MKGLKNATHDPFKKWRDAQVVPRPELRNQRCECCDIRVPVKPVGRPKNLCYDHERMHDKELNRQKARRCYHRNAERYREASRLRMQQRRKEAKMKQARLSTA